jgi:hypothetical protein
MLKLHALPKWSIEWAKAIFNPLPWVMTLWYWQEKTFLNSLPLFELYDFHNTLCQPFTDGMDGVYSSLISVTLFFLYPTLSIFYFFWYWKTSKPKWICWCVHVLVWFLLWLLGTSYGELLSD